MVVMARRALIVPAHTIYVWELVHRFIGDILQVDREECRCLIVDTSAVLPASRLWKAKLWLWGRCSGFVFDFL